MVEENEICCICQGALDEEHMARCAICGMAFHLAWSRDADVPNCGTYSVDEGSMALVFACGRCAEEKGIPRQG